LSPPYPSRPTKSRGIVAELGIYPFAVAKMPRVAYRDWAARLRVPALDWSMPSDCSEPAYGGQACEQKGGNRVEASPCDWILRAPAASHIKASGLGLEIFHGAPVSRAPGRVAAFAANTKGSTVAIQSRLTKKSKFSVDFRFLHLPRPWQDRASQSGIVPGS